MWQDRNKVLRTPIPGGSICARQHHTDTAARYRKVSGLHFVIFGIVYIWLNEQHRRQELEITSQKIRCLRKDIHEVYVKKLF